MVRILIVKELVSSGWDSSEFYCWTDGNWVLGLGFLSSQWYHEVNESLQIHLQRLLFLAGKLSTRSLTLRKLEIAEIKSTWNFSCLPKQTKNLKEQKHTRNHQVKEHDVQVITKNVRKQKVPIEGEAQKCCEFCKWDRYDCTPYYCSLMYTLSLVILELKRYLSGKEN